MLLGRSGAGKSAAGNNILGQELFESHPDLIPVTQKCEKKKALVEGRKVGVLKVLEMLFVVLFLIFFHALYPVLLLKPERN